MATLTTSTEAAMSLQMPLAAGISRRELLRLSMKTALGAAVFGGLSSGSFAVAPKPGIEVWRTRDCSCCGKWITHLQDQGFTVQSRVVADVSPIRTTFGMPESLSSCHTARIDGYVIEGHVPAADILRLTRERPAALGLSVPEMPLGSPGMESGGVKAAYDVLLVAKNGGTRVFNSYR